MNRGHVCFALFVTLVVVVLVNAYVDSQKANRRDLCGRGYAPDLCAEFWGVR